MRRSCSPRHGGSLAKWLQMGDRATGSVARLLSGPRAAWPRPFAQPLMRVGDHQLCRASTRRAARAPPTVVRGAKEVELSKRSRSWKGADRRHGHLGAPAIAIDDGDGDGARVTAPGRDLHVRGPATGRRVASIGVEEECRRPACSWRRGHRPALDALQVDDQVIYEAGGDALDIGSSRSPPSAPSRPCGSRRWQ